MPLYYPDPDLKRKIFCYCFCDRGMNWKWDWASLTGGHWFLFFLLFNYSYGSYFNSMIRKKWLFNKKPSHVVFVMVAVKKKKNNGTYSLRQCDILGHWRQLEATDVSRFRLHRVWSPSLQLTVFQQSCTLFQRLIFIWIQSRHLFFFFLVVFIMHHTWPLPPLQR